jgi:hypothetical protein
MEAMSPCGTAGGRYGRRAWPGGLFDLRSRGGNGPADGMSVGVASTECRHNSAVCVVQVQWQQGGPQAGPRRLCWLRRRPSPLAAPKPLRAGAADRRPALRWHYGPGAGSCRAMWGAWRPKTQLYSCSGFIAEGRYCRGLPVLMLRTCTAMPVSRRHRQKSGQLHSSCSDITTVHPYLLVAGNPRPTMLTGSQQIQSLS